VSQYTTGLRALLGGIALALASTSVASAQDTLRNRDNPRIENPRPPRVLRDWRGPPVVRGFRSDVPSMRNAEPSSPAYDYLLSRPPSSTLVAPMR
jgi:hypothetical protein